MAAIRATGSGRRDPSAQRPLLACCDGLDGRVQYCVDQLGIRAQPDGPADNHATEAIDHGRHTYDIEHGLRVLKSEIGIALVFHRLPERIRAHAGICFLALILYRVMRQRLRFPIIAPRHADVLAALKIESKRPANSS